mgnify:CR=1 FL=1
MRNAGRGDHVFVDTSAYFAAVNRRDAAHERVAALMQELVQARRQSVTTNFVLAELHALLLNRTGRRMAALVLADVEASTSTTVVHVGVGDDLREREIVYGYTDKDFSLTDAISFAVMERLGISQAFTLDRNFVQFGWSVLDRSAGH